MTKILNYTGRDINIMTSNGNIMIKSIRELKASIFRSSGDVVIFEDKRVNLGCTDIIGDDESLPPVIDGTIYIVTSIIYSLYWRTRYDFYTIDEPVKDGAKIIGFKSITRSNLRVNLRESLDKVVTDMYQKELNLMMSEEEKQDYILQIKELVSKI